MREQVASKVTVLSFLHSHLPCPHASCQRTPCSYASQRRTPCPPLLLPGHPAPTSFPSTGRPPAPMPPTTQDAYSYGRNLLKQCSQKRSYISTSVICKTKLQAYLPGKPSLHGAPRKPHLPTHTSILGRWLRAAVLKHLEYVGPPTQIYTKTDTTQHPN